MKRYGKRFISGFLEVLLSDCVVDGEGRPVRIPRKMDKTYAYSWRSKIDAEVMGVVESEATTYLRLHSEELFVFTSYLTPMATRDMWVAIGEAYAHARNGTGSFAAGHPGAAFVEAALTDSAANCGRLLLVSDGKRIIGHRYADGPRSLLSHLKYDEIGEALEALVVCFQRLATNDIYRLTDRQYEVAVRLLRVSGP